MELLSYNAPERLREGEQAGSSEIFLCVLRKKNFVVNKNVGSQLAQEFPSK